MHGLTDVALIQQEHSAWRDHNFPNPAIVGVNHGTDIDGLLGMLEELGELAHATLKWEQGVRVLTMEEWREKAADAMGDVFVYMVSFANSNGFDLDEILANTWQQVRSRDWQADPPKGVAAQDQ